MHDADFDPAPMNRFRCACGRSIVVHAVFTSEDWERLVDGKHDPYALCWLCADERALALGLRLQADAFFRGSALTSRITPELQLAIGGWRLPELARLGSVGNPRLYNPPRTS